MAYTIGNFGFVRWNGPAPQLVSNHLRLFTKAGQPGVSAQAMGVHGDPFEVELHAVFETQAQGEICENGYRFLVANSPQIVVYNLVNYFTVYQHRYLVLAVKIDDFRRYPRLTGLNYDYVGGWLIRSRWQLQPVTQ